MKSSNVPLIRRVALLAAISLQSVAVADVTPNALFSDHMVLQRGMPLPVWGTADDGEKVTVKLGDTTETVETKDGRWMVRLPELKAGGPMVLSISGKNTVTIKDVMVGEVWICSGQSNMQWPVERCANAESVIADSANDKIRLFDVPRLPADDPQYEVKGHWVVCGPKTVAGFSGVGYFFGRDLQKELGVAVGLIGTNFGGTPAEAWTSRETLADHPQLSGILASHEQRVAGYEKQLARWKKQVAQAKKEGKEAPDRRKGPQDPRNKNRPSGLYNAMIAPLVPYAIRGAIWYQGESNSGRAHEYDVLFPTMIQDWRDQWGEGDFPFLFVQLAPFKKIVNEPVESDWAELRESQRRTLDNLPKTGMAVITDVGEENDIHPRRKEPVGHRLALAALRIAYGMDIPWSGPSPSKVDFGGGKATIEFEHADDGLVAKDGPLTGFTIAGSDRHFVKADATIEGNKVVVSSPEVPDPKFVRFGWSNYPVVNLWNGAGLPASPFETSDGSTDHWTTRPKQ